MRQRYQYQKYQEDTVDHKTIPTGPCMQIDISWRTEGKRRGADLRMRTKVSGMAKSGRRQWQMATSAVRLSKLQGAEVATFAYCTGQIIAISSDSYRWDVPCKKFFFGR